MSTFSTRPSASANWSGSATRQTGAPERGTPAVAAPDVLLHSQLGKYRILRQLGQGGMGRVYEAEDIVLKRLVALKVLLETSADNEQALRRFLHEAQSIARLNHPNIVAIHEADERDGICFIVMELVQGQSAEARLHKDGPFPWREATRIITGVCHGLAAAHAAGLIHRDIKPGNIMLAGDTVKLGDFGLAKALDPGAPALTGPGIVVGTPDYMSPEQCRSEPFDERTDIYSLGAAYYALLTGETPFHGEASFQVMMAHCSYPTPDPRQVNPDVDPRCTAVVQRAMAKQPTERYQHAVEMQVSLEELLHGTTGGAALSAATRKTAPLLPVVRPGASARRWRRWLAIAAGLVLLGGAVPWMRSFTGKVNHNPVINGTMPSTAGSSTVASEADFAAFDPSGITEGGLTIPLGKPISGVAISPDGKHLAVASADAAGGVRIWDWPSGKPRLLLWKGQRVHSLDFSADGQQLAVAGSAGIRVWNFAKHAELALVPGVEARAVAYSPLRRLLVASWQTDQAVPVQLLDADSGKEVYALGDFRQPIHSVAVSRDGLLLAAGGQEGTIRVWNALTGKPMQEFTLPQRINRIAFTPEREPIREQLAAATADRIHYRSVLTWKTQTIWPQHAMTPTVDIKTVAFSPNGRLAVSAGWHGDRSAVLFNREQFGFSNRYGHRDGITSFAFSPDSLTLVSGSNDGTVRLWDVRRFHERGAPQGK